MLKRLLGMTKERTEMTENQRDIMRHALGYGSRNPGYRNHFCTGPGSTDYPHCEALVEAGMMSRREGSALSGGDYVYHVTDAGRAALKTPNASFSREPERSGGESAGSES